MESDDEYFFMNDAKFDYKLLQEQMRMQTPREYKGVNYIVQAGNMDKMIAASLLHEEKSLKGMLTTEEFKALVLDINAENWDGNPNE